MKYRKLPVEIEAFRYGIDNRPDWFCDKVSSNDIITFWNDNCKDLTFCRIKTLEGIMEANYGDYIIQGIAGEIYLCKQDIFEKTYEAV